MVDQNKTTISAQNLLQLVVHDDQEVSKLESMVYSKVTAEIVTTEICSRSTTPLIFELLRKVEKSTEDYDVLLIRDTQLTFGSIDFG